MPQLGPVLVMSVFGPYQAWRTLRTWSLRMQLIGLFSCSEAKRLWWPVEASRTGTKIANTKRRGPETPSLLGNMITMFMEYILVFLLFPSPPPTRCCFKCTQNYVAHTLGESPLSVFFFFMMIIRSSFIHPPSSFNSTCVLALTRDFVASNYPALLLM